MLVYEPNRVMIEYIDAIVNLKLYMKENFLLCKLLERWVGLCLKSEVSNLAL